jgi:hypothetical protein
MEEPEFPAALLDADYALFVVPASLKSPSVFPTAHISFVDLYNAIQRLRIDFLHRGSDAMAEIPCRLVGKAENPLELVGAHSLARLAEQVDAKEPLPEGQMGVIEDRPGSDAELIAAGIAIKLVALYNPRNLAGKTARAHNGIRPAKRLKVFAAFLFAAELLNQSAKINGVFLA